MAQNDESLLQRVTELEGIAKRILSILEQGGGGGGGGGGAVDSATVSSDDWKSLGQKLDKLEDQLNPKEKAVLLTLLGAAAATYARAGVQESPVSSAPSVVKVSGPLSKVRLSDGLRSIGSFQTGVGAFGGGGGPAEDSIGVGGDFTCVHGDWSKDLKSQTIGDTVINAGRWNALANVGAVTRPDVAGGFGRSGLGGGFG